MYVPSWFDVRMVVNAFMMRWLPAGWCFTWSPREMELTTFRHGARQGRYLLRYYRIRNSFEVLHRQERFGEECVSTTILAIPFLGSIQLTASWLGRTMGWIGWIGLTANKELLAILTPKRDWLWDYSKTWQAVGSLVIKESMVNSRSEFDTLVVPHRTSQYARSEYTVHVVVRLIMREWRIHRWLGIGPSASWYESFEFYCPDPPQYREVYRGEAINRTATNLLTHRRYIEGDAIWNWENYAGSRSHVEPVFVEVIEQLRHGASANLQITSRGLYTH